MPRVVVPPGHEAAGPICQHFRRAAEIVGQRWNPQILAVLLAGPSRFGGIRTAVPGISDNLLSERLKALEAEGILRREVTPDTPVRIEYSLTEKGAGLADAIDALAEWAERWAEADAEPAPRLRRSRSPA
jgi:DNA-binding HxlR family transcriptional regulator